MTMSTDGDLWCESVPLPDGRSVSFFLNKRTGLVVVDVIDADEEGGNEFVRTHVPAVDGEGRFALEPLLAEERA